MKNHKVLSIFLGMILGLIMLVLFLILFVVIAGYTIKTVGGAIIKPSVTLEKKKSGDKIGVVEINGIIMKSRPTVELLHKAEQDEEIKAIIVRINSPGGAVAPTQEIFEEIRRIDQTFDPKEGKGLPVYASFATLAASGGYYIGVGAREIYANPGTITGSIGVIMNFIDMEKLYEWAKLKPEVIKSGRFKDIGSPYRPMKNEERKLLSDVASNIHRQFMGDILKGRKNKIKRPLEELADGRVFSGSEALQHGLVDELASLWEAGRRIHKKLNLKGEADLKFIKKRKKVDVFEILEQFEKITNYIGQGAFFIPQKTLMFLSH